MKETTDLANEKTESEYRFYRTLVKNVMFKLKSVQEQRVISTWVVRCDQEDDESLKCAYIKLLLISLQHPGDNIKYFRRTAPKYLPFLESTPKELADLIDRSLTEDSDSDSDSDAPNGDWTVSAAVSSDLTSLATALADRNCVRVFYARSDHTIDRWRWPNHVQVPLDSLSPSQWERALSSRLAAVPDRKRIVNRYTVSSLDHIPYFYKPNDVHAPYNWNKVKSKFMTPAQRTCRDLMSEQTVKDSKNDEFRWFERSRLDGTMRPSDDIRIDMDTMSDHQEKIQLELDERAKNSVNVLYPDRVRIVLDPLLVSEVTGTDLHPTDDDQSFLRTTRETLEVYPESVGPVDDGGRIPSTKYAVETSDASDVDPGIVGETYERFVGLLSKINDGRSYDELNVEDGSKFSRPAGRQNDRFHRFGETTGQRTDRSALRSMSCRYDIITTSARQPTEHRRIRFVAGCDNPDANGENCCGGPMKRVPDSGRPDRVEEIRRMPPSRQPSIFATDGDPLSTLSAVHRRNQRRYGGDPRRRSTGARCAGSEAPEPDRRPENRPPRSAPVAQAHRMNSSLRRPKNYDDPYRRLPPRTSDRSRSRHYTCDAPGSYVPPQHRPNANDVSEPGVTENGVGGRRRGVPFTLTGTIRFDGFETTDERWIATHTFEDILENGSGFGGAASREFAVPSCRFVRIDEDAPENRQRTSDVTGVRYKRR